ncbi:MAG: proline--tRNA ligase [Chloroflexi bacterium]|nr:proline--tRNA ligase [Chloroflexota bacterium]
MRFSRLFGRTLRQAPAEAETANHKLLLRAALIRQVSAGVYSFLPLGWRVARKVEAIIRDEMDRIDGQEILMPVLNPAELWQESGRWSTIGPELIRLRDRADREFVLAMTHEEIVTDLARREVRSYRQLPFMLYQIQTKIRDEARPRGGLVRLREFLMKDAYSFHPDTADLDAFYPTIYQAYVNVFRRCGVDVRPVEADPGMIGGTGSHEFVLPTPIGEDTIVQCTGCTYAANVEQAVAIKQLPESPSLAVVELPELVNTPGAKTIDQLADFFGLPSYAFLKSVFYHGDQTLVAAVIRGDLDVNEAKLVRALKTTNLRLASDEELRAAGIVPGYGSPVGVANLLVIADDSVPGRPFIAGANRPDFHLRHVLLSRDFRADQVADIATAEEGHLCERCGGRLVAERGIELGHTFKLGTKYSQAMGATFLGPNGRETEMVMGCYGIGVDRLLAAIVQQCHDDRGITWPVAVAPFHLHLVALNVEDASITTRAEEVYRRLEEAGCEVLFDDRAETPGVKFADADLIGIPLRLTVSRRTLATDSVEIKPRTAKEARLVTIGELLAEIGRQMLIGDSGS